MPRNFLLGMTPQAQTQARTPWWQSPMASAGAGLLSQGINALIQGGMNQQTQAFNIAQYNRQRADALADWHMNNAYNHPAAQMERLREAKLNPNLVYGSGANTGQASPVRGTDAKAWNPNPPQFDLGSVMGQYQDTRIRQAQYDNLREQNTLIKQEQALKSASTLEKLANTDRKRYDLDLDKGLRDVYQATKRATLENLESTTQARDMDIRNKLARYDLEVKKYEVAAAKTAQGIRESVQRVINMRLQAKQIEANTALTRIRSAKTDQEYKNAQMAYDKAFWEIEKLKTGIAKEGFEVQLKELEKEQKAMGVEAGDWWITRSLNRVFNYLLENNVGYDEQE